ncbi:MAG: PepSY-associated TM helix domain-containing protein [Blastocatellia bacterium]|nr:PepSY-associated TM helix domain-containing protein [Blastocatellia bacterium]
MKTFRKILFWCHLCAGVTAGIIVLVMSVTGLLLTYEKQMIGWADKRAYQAALATPGAARLAPEALLARVREAGSTPTSLTVRADAAAPASVTVPNANGRGERTVFVNPYTGALLGDGAQGTRHFFHVVTDWHRWLGREGDGRAVGRAITGASNLLFLFIVMSGLYLWFPRALAWAHFKQILWFRRGLPGKARDFNWHNVIGFWCCVPLFIVVLGAVVISYPWASDLVYRAAGEAPPRPGGASPGGAGGPAAAPTSAGLDPLMQRAEQHRGDWRTITARLPRDPAAPVAFSIDAGMGGQPQKRETLTLDRAGQVVKREQFSDNTRGRQWRLLLRFAHTGEFWGAFGQTIAGIASLGACFLAYTGWALSWRRFQAWRARRARSGEPAVAATSSS